MKLSHAMIRGLALAVLAIIVITGMGACAPRAVPMPPVVKQEAAPQAKSAAPVLANAQQVTGKADQQGAVSAAQLAKAQQAATTAQGKARTALVEAERLAKQKTATEAELAQQSALVRELNGILDNMSADLAETAASLRKEKELRVEASAMLVHAQELVRQKDAEADALRLQFKHAAEQAAAYYTAADTNAKAAMTAQGQIEAAKGSLRTWRGIAIWCGVAAALLFLVFVVLPLLRRTSMGI